MGISTDGILYFGFDFLDADNHKLEESDPLQVALELGMDSYVNQQIKRHNLQNKFKTADDFLKEYGVKIGFHCHHQYPIYYICLERSEVIANRGTSVDLSSKLAISFSYIEIAKLRTVCDLLDIPFKQPAWTLASYWG